MKRFRPIIALMLLTVCTVVSAAGSPPTLVTANRVEQQRFRWKDRTIKIAISSSLTKQNGNIKADSDVVGAVKRSLQAWEAAAGIEFELDSSDRQSVSSVGDGVSIITIAPSAENILLFGDDSQSTAALTKIFHNGRGFITEADIVLNPLQQFSTDGTVGTFDLQSTLTHEIGHLLGLRHSGVMGASMSEKLAKVGALGFVDMGARVLAESDITAIRDLYGAGTETADCCASVTGKLTVPVGKSFKNLRVWAEDSSTGRVLGQADVGTDGRFRLGGLPPGTHNFYWKARSGTNGSSSGELGELKIETGEPSVLNQKISFGPSTLALEFLGVNGQLGESGISIEGGRQQMIYLGGKGLDPKTVEIEFASPFLHVVPFSSVRQDFGDDVSVISLSVMVDPETPPGVYSIFARGEDGSKAAVIGALKVN
ncbi:MAG TPA: matrixin family metalloprotease [Pyrinomonadaceae bacterium]|nr:matrixin family metalloprotease [Pyrinomonadaceae bacterium]